MSEETTEVREYVRPTPSGGVTQVSKHRRRVNKRNMTPDEKAEQAQRRAKIAEGWRAIAREETDDTEVEYVGNFAELNTQHQMISVGIMADVPVLLHGATATGKTAVLSAMAESIGFGLTKFFPHRYEANDLAGLPATVDDVDEEGKRTWNLRHFPTQWAKDAAGGNNVILIDEMLRADEKVQGAIMGMIDDNGLPEAGIVFGPGVRFVGATNPTSYDAGSYDIIPPLQRRFFNMGWPADTKGMNQFIDHNFWEVFDGEIEPPEKEEFISGYHKWRGLTSGFISAQGAVHIHNEPNEEQASSQKKQSEIDDLDPGLGWPNMDSWKKVWRMLAIADHIGATEETKIQIVSCALGSGTGLAFWTYQKNLDLPNIDEIIADPNSFKGLEKEDQAFIVANQLTDRIRNGGDGQQLAAVFEIMDKIEKTHFDIAIPKQQQIVGWFMQDRADGGTRFGDAPPDLMKRMMERADDYMVPMAEAGLGFMSKGKKTKEEKGEEEKQELLGYSYPLKEDIRYRSAPGSK